MELRAKIDALVSQIARMGDWKSARDAVGSNEPEPFAEEVVRLVTRYPFVKRATDWLEFLRVYGGGMMTRERDMLSVGLYGFSDDVSLPILDGPGEPIECGCLLFGDVVLPKERIDGYTEDTISLGFGLDSTGARPWGVYRVRDRQSHWYCSSFIEWMERLVQRGGRLIE
ncbi:MAG: hypothetical protein JWN44_1212 [Myxococcales bacterium]|nr:hypothetical protein [Myxococcales bacterium]